MVSEDIAMLSAHSHEPHRRELPKQWDLGRHLSEEATCSSSLSNIELMGHELELIRRPQEHKLEIRRPWQQLGREAVERIERIHGDRGFYENENTIDRILDTIQEVQRLTGENIKTQQLIQEVELQRLENAKQKKERQRY